MNTPAKQTRTPPTAHERLKLLRKRLRKSQAEMAGVLHISLRGYQNYERGEREIPVVTLERAQEHFGLNPDWMLDGTGPMLNKSDLQPGPDLAFDAQLLLQALRPLILVVLQEERERRRAEWLADAPQRMARQMESFERQAAEWEESEKRRAQFLQRRPGRQPDAAADTAAATPSAVAASSPEDLA